MAEINDQHAKMKDSIQAEDAFRSDISYSTTSEPINVDRLAPTPTVIGALKQFAPGDPISAVICTKAILDQSDHRKSYAGGMFSSLELKETETKKPAKEWLDEVQTLFDPGRMQLLTYPTQPPALHGRLAIIGFALLDRQLYEQIKQYQTVETLVIELHPNLGSLTDILSDHGRDIYAKLEPTKREDIDSADTVPNWPDDPLQKTEEDLLGRIAFARFLGKRIVAIPPDSGAYAIHLYGPWGAGKTTLLNFLGTELTAKHLYLFDIDSKYKDELDAGRLSSEVRKKFEQHYEFLARDAGLQVPLAEGDWKIDEKSQNYLLRNKQQQPGGNIEVFTSQRRWMVVEFNAWRNQHIDPPWWSLLDAVFQGTKKALSLRNYLREYWWRLISGRVLYIFSAVVLMWILVLAFGWVQRNIIFPLTLQNKVIYDVLGTVAAAADSLSTIIAIIVTIWGGIVAVNRSLLLGSAGAAATYKQRAHDPMNEIKKRFNTLIARLSPQRVAVFIDDLDRCQSSYVVELLEGIQTLFREAPVVYVISADSRWMNACYAREYEKLAPQIHEPGKSLGTLFLEKAFRFSTPMPGVPEELRKQYWLYLLQLKSEEKKFDLDNARRKAQETVSQAKGEGDLYDLVADSNALPFVEQQAVREEAAVRLAAPEVVERLEHTLKPYAGLLDPNPRAMKRLVNAYSINRALAILSRNDIDRHQLVLWTILQQRWPQLAGFLEQHPQMVEKIGKQDLPDVNEDLKGLFKAEDVAVIAKGGSLGANLQEAAIEKFARMHF